MARWLASRGVELAPPLSAVLIPGGRSQLTYRLSDATGRAWVVRRPPLGHILPSAHDVVREARFIGALAGTGVRVPELVGTCADEDVIGAPFFVTAFVEGLVLDSVDAGAAIPLAARVVAAESLVDTLAALHTVEPDRIGLGDIARRDGYVERQLRRWRRQVAAREERSPLLEKAADRLEAAVPPQRVSAIVHGDFRLGNVIVDPAGELRAVLDWELATLGDPRADLGWLVAWWAGPEERHATTSPTAAGGFPGRAAVVERYVAAGGDASELAFFVAFAFWRNACITAGVLDRYRAGVMGDVEYDDRALAAGVEALAQTTIDVLTGQGPVLSDARGRTTERTVP